MSNNQTAEGDPFVWAYRAGKMGPMGNSPKDVRDYERWTNSADEMQFKEVSDNSNIELLGYPGLVSEIVVDLRDWQ